MKKAFYFLGVFIFAQCAKAQRTVIYGSIFAAETREPLAFANFYFGTTGLGFYSDFEGKFSFVTDSLPSDSLMCQYMGYLKKLIMIRRDTLNPLEIEMIREEKRVSAVAIHININPALKWVKLAQDNRQKNNPDKLQFYSCETFTKNSIAVNNISERLKKGKFGEEIGALFDTISYISSDNKSILPIFLSEVLSDYYFNRNPYLSKEVIKASKVKGIGVQDGTFISQLLGSTFVNYNFYQNSLVVIDKGIPSPIGENSTNLYRYELVNVDRSKARRVFQIYCEPRVPKDLAFYGFIWIEEISGALLRLSLELNGNSNLNYIDKLRITQEYAATANGAYFNVNNRVVVDAREMSTKAAGAVATSTVTSRNVDVFTERPPKFYDSRVVMLPGATEKSDSFWIAHRHIAANAAEKRIEAKIDTLINLPRVRTYVDVANFLIDGYRSFGKIDLGPYYNLVSYNQLEGLRTNLGFRTSTKFSKNWKIEGFLAYGYKDQKFKYSMLADRILYRKKWTKLGVLYKKDVEQIGITDNENYGASLFTAFNLLGSNNLNYNRDARITFGTDIRNGLRVTLSAGNRYYKFEKVNTFNFAWFPNFPDTSKIAHSFLNSYLTLGIKYAPRNYFLQNDNRRVNFSGIGPEYYFQYIQGIKNILQSDFNYQRVIIGVTYNKVWGSIGRTSTNLEVARVFGVLPFPLLNMYVGNQSFIYNPNAYNKMNIFEFITDRSISAAVEHHFNGLMFNRIPLLRYLKWREILGGKIIYGSLDKRNFDLIPYSYDGEPISRFKTFDHRPYAEISAGIENIFKLIRVDAVWRLTYRSANNVRNFGVKASVSLGF